MAELGLKRARRDWSLDSFLNEKKAHSAFIRALADPELRERQGMPDHQPLENWIIFKGERWETAKRHAWEGAGAPSRHCLENSKYWRIMESLPVIAHELGIDCEEVRKAGTEAETRLSRLMSYDNPILRGAMDAAYLMGVTLALYDRKYDNKNWLEYAFGLWKPITKGYGVADMRGDMVCVFYSDEPISARVKSALRKGGERIGRLF